MPTACDLCDKPFPTEQRRVHYQPRPSDPTELVATMWACPRCAQGTDWPTPAQLSAEVEAGRHPGVLFVTV